MVDLIGTEQATALLTPHDILQLACHDLDTGLLLLLFRFNVTVSGTCDWPYSDNSPLYFAHFAAESTLLF